MSNVVYVVARDCGTDFTHIGNIRMELAVNAFSHIADRQ